MRKICTIIFIILPIVGCKGNVAPLPSLAINYITESGVLPPGGIILLSVSVNAPTTATLSYSWATSNGFNIATDTHKMTVAVVTPYTYGTTGTATVTVTYAGSSYPFTASSIRMDTQAVTGPITLQTNAPWPKYMQNIEQTGLSGVDTSSTTGTLKWKYPIGKQCGSPAIDANGTIYIICTDNGVLYAISSTGGLKWTYTTGWNIASLIGVANVTMESFIFPVPAIGNDETIYVPGYSTKDGGDMLYVLNQNGELKWSYPIGALYSLLIPSSGLYIPSSPTIGTNGVVYVAIFGVLFALNPNGTLNWINQNYSSNNCSLVYGTPAIDSNGILYVSGEDGGLCSIDQNGIPQWNGFFSALVLPLSSPPTIKNNTIYFSLGVGVTDFSLTSLVAVNSQGNEQWGYIDNDITESTLTAPAIGSDGTVYFGTGNGLLYAINPDGTLKWAYVNGIPIVSNPVIGADGTIYFGDTDGKLYAFTPQGLPRWTDQTGGSIDSSSPAIGADGTIYVASDDGYLYAIH